MTFKIIYGSSHNCNLLKGNPCFCSKGGFTSVKMASIYAYHHIRCNICKEDQRIRSLGKDEFIKVLKKSTRDMSDKEIADFFSFYKDVPVNIVDKWIDCDCSSEWLIVKEN